MQSNILNIGFTPVKEKKKYFPCLLELRIRYSYFVLNVTDHDTATTEFHR